MDPLSFIVSGILVYVAVVVFIVGSIWAIIRWLRTPKSPVHQGMFPLRRGLPRAIKLGKDSLFFPQVLDTDPWMWLFVFGMHLAGVGLFVGHMRLITELPFANLIGAANMENLANIVGGGIGVALFIAFLYFLFRRFKSPYRELSVPEDYLLLVLILLLILLGDHLRFTQPFNLQDYRDYMSSLLHFSPSFPVNIKLSASKWILDAHVLTADLLLIYFPFSKLVHSIGGFAGNLLRSE
jgi:[DsrC]-trisulfide reductase subunit M